MMKNVLWASAFALLLIVVSTAPAPAATNRYTFSHLTFSGSVQLPGVALPAGTYTFMRVSPRVIQVLSRDHRRSYGMFMTIPTLRHDQTTKQEIVFGEPSVGEPPPIKTWFPVPLSALASYNWHRSVGYEFLY